MESSRKMLGGSVLFASLAVLSLSALVKADEQFWPVSAPVYAERHPSVPPVTLDDPTVSATTATHTGYTAAQDSAQPDVFVMPAWSSPTAAVQPAATVQMAAAVQPTTPVVTAGVMLPPVADSAAKGCETTTAVCAQACACSNMFDHKTGVFAEYLLLRAFDIDMAHGIQQNGVGGLGTAPDGDVGTVQPQFSSGFRVGVDWACCCCSDVGLTYTDYNSSRANLVNAASGVGGTAASLVLFPNTVTAASTFDSLLADYDVDFQTVDVDYSTLMCGTPYAKANFVIGVRYAHLQQNFSQDGEFSGATGSELTTTNIAFDGIGMRTGLNGQWQLGGSRFALYGRSYLNVLFGSFTSNYQQLDVTTDTVEANSHWVDGRVLPILETQFGLEWTSCNDCCKFSIGYETSYWFNAVDTAEFIQAVQHQSFTNASQTIAFTGLAARATVQF